MTGRKRNPRPDPEFADTAFVSAQDIAKIYGIPAAYIVKTGIEARTIANALVRAIYQH